MRYVVVGAGAVGGAIGARLAESGHEVVLVARGAHRKVLAEHGLRFAAPEGETVHRLPVVGGPNDLDLAAEDVLILAVKTQDTDAAAAA